MSRTERLLELMIRIGVTPRFTVGEMAQEFRVSRRTMLRDLQALSAIGLPLAATPGPHGGYTLVRPQRLVPLSFTADEAIGLVLSYEAFVHYAASPFATQSVSAITKLRAALPPAVVRDLDRLRKHVAVVNVPRTYAAPLLPDLLQAALDGVHLHVVYDSKSGMSERLIYPFGVLARQGFWYCACFDGRRQAHVLIRADRVISLARREGLDRPGPYTLQEWLDLPEHTTDCTLLLRASVTARGMKLLEWGAFGDGLTVTEQGTGSIDMPITASEIAYYARLFLRMGPDATVETPPELIGAVQQLAQETLAHYERQATPVSAERSTFSA